MKRQSPETASQSDEELFEEFRETRDEQLLGLLMKRYADPLLFFLKRYVSEHIAEEVQQEAWLSIAQKSEQYVSGRSFKSWLFTIAGNRAIDFQRREKRHREMVRIDAENEDGGMFKNILHDSVKEPIDILSLEEERERVRVNVARLTDAHQQVIDAVYVKGLKYREAADVLEVPAGTVKSRLHAGIVQLKEMYADVA